MLVCLIKRERQSLRREYVQSMHVSCLAEGKKRTRCLALLLCIGGSTKLISSEELPPFTVETTRGVFLSLQEHGDAFLLAKHQEGVRSHTGYIVRSHVFNEEMF